MDAKSTFISAIELSNELGLPLAWLKTEAEAGRIPSLRANRRLMFNCDAVKGALLKRARELPEADRP